MKLKLNLFQLGLAACVASLGIGCGGLSASHGISPAGLLLPGLGQNSTQPETPAEQADNPEIVSTVASHQAS